MRRVFSPSAFVASVKPEPFQIGRFAKVLAPPIAPGPKGVAACQQRRPRRSTNAVRVELSQLEAFGGKAIHVGRQFRVAAVETGLAVSHVIRQDQDDVGPRAGNVGSVNAESADRDNQQQKKKSHINHTLLSSRLLSSLVTCHLFPGSAWEHTVLEAPPPGMSRRSLQCIAFPGRSQGTSCLGGCASRVGDEQAEPAMHCVPRQEPGNELSWRLRLAGRG